MPAVKKPEYAKHPAYPGLLAAVSMKLAFADRNNQFDLDGLSNAQRFVNNMLGVKKVHAKAFGGNPLGAIEAMADPAKQPLTLDQAACTIAWAAGLEVEAGEAKAELLRRQWLRESTLRTIRDPSQLTNGDAYMLIRDVTELHAGVKYE
jgi:hypothetical protein